MIKLYVSNRHPLSQADRETCYKGYQEALALLEFTRRQTSFSKPYNARKIRKSVNAFGIAPYGDQWHVVEIPRGWVCRTCKTKERALNWANKYQTRLDKAKIDLKINPRSTNLY